MKKFFLIFFLFANQLIAFASPADTSKNVLYSWKLVEGILVEPAVFDTVIDNIHMYNPVERQSINYSYLGNIGSPWKSNIFFSGNLNYQSDFIFERNYYPYLLTKDNMVFYHSRKPYFDINWATATKKRDENQLSALYTQNINKKWNVGIRYKLISSKGEIPRSTVSEHSMNFFASYIGEKYSMHTAFIRNKFENLESGGVDDSSKVSPEFIDPLLQNASSVYRKRGFFISQQYKFGFTEKIVVDDSTTESTFKELGRINYVFSWDRNNRKYSHKGSDYKYYLNTIDTTTETFDSLFLGKIENSVYWTFKEIKKENFNGRLSFGGTHEFIRWSHVNQDSSYHKIEDYNNIKLSGNLDARTKNFIFSVSAYYYPKISNSTAHKSGNYWGNALIEKSIGKNKWRTDFYFNLSHANVVPYLFEQNYQSNHFNWKNSFKNKLYTESKVGFRIPQVLFDLQFAYGMNNNHIYFDSEAIPVQYKDPLTISSIRLQKDFKIGGFRFLNKVIYQVVNNKDEVISLPKWSIYHSSFYDLKKYLEKISIEAQLGYELYYNTTFYANGYMPATGQFFEQRIRKTGDFPIVNVFMNLRIKNVLLFFKFENLSIQFVPIKFYYYTNNYPINTTAFKFGVSWRFMD
jgi:hypothetical protein